MLSVNEIPLKTDVHIDFEREEETKKAKSIQKSLRESSLYIASKQMVSRDIDIPKLFSFCNNVIEG